MGKRRRFTEREVLYSLLLQGAVIPCYRCKMAFHLDGAADDGHHFSQAEREHVHELALGGADDPRNCRYSASECHKSVTNGTKATSAGSSKHRIAKANRLAKGGRKRKGPKMRARGFDKRFRRRMDGTVERVTGDKP